MLGALLYLRFTSFKNWVIARVRRLRQPKYLFGAIVGCAYFYFFFFRGFGENPARHARHAATEQAVHAIEAANIAVALDWLPATTAVGALALLVFMTLMWVVPAQRAALGFSEAEIAFLFPAPISRRALVHFRLLSSQFRSLLGAAVMMLFSNRWSVVGGNPLTHALGWWFIFSALNLHYSGANFTLTRLVDAGLSVWRRRVLVLFGLVAVLAVTVFRLPAAARLPSPGAGVDLRPITAWIIELTGTAPLGWLLWPLKQIVAPFLAVGARDFLFALGPALALITLHYLWVVQSAVAFEDASIDHAQKRSARIAAWRSGQRRTRSASTQARRAPFHLASRGRPEFAFLWKNLLSTWPYFTARAFLICAALIAAGSLWLHSQSSVRVFLPVISGIALIFAAYALIVGPQFARQDIRSDLVHADILKTYPIAGWQIVLGELLTPVAILTGVLWLALLTITLTFDPGVPWLTPQLRLACTAGAAAIVPLLATLQLLVPNAAALLFPSWFQVMRTRGGGPEVIGQRMIFFFAQVLTMVLALLPAVGLAGLLIFILQWLIGPVVAVLIGALTALIVLGGEVWCGLWLLGERFERLDLSAEVRT